MMMIRYYIYCNLFAFVILFSFLVLSAAVLRKFSKISIRWSTLKMPIFSVEVLDSSFVACSITQNFMERRLDCTVSLTRNIPMTRLAYQLLVKRSTENSSACLMKRIEKPSTIYINAGTIFPVSLSHRIREFHTCVNIFIKIVEQPRNLISFPMVQSSHANNAHYSTIHYNSSKSFSTILFRSLPN